MNVSPVNPNVVSFGRIRRSAAEQAIKEANGDISKLDPIKDAIESQKDISYDIVAYKGHYLLTPNNSEVPYSEYKTFDTLQEACSCATELHHSYLRKTEFSKMAEEILSSCEE